MWSPTHVQLTVLRAKNLARKGKGGQSNAFVTIQLGKDKFQTTVVENSADPEWEEECDLTYKESDANVVLNVFHRNFFGLDEFLGQVVLPLSDYGVYDSPKTRWHFLSNKPGKKDDRERGELEIRLSFVVRDNSSAQLQEAKKSLSGSFMDVASAVGHKIQKLPTRSLSLKLDRLDSRFKLDRFRGRRSSPSTEDTGSDMSLGSSGCESQHPKTLRHRSMSLSRLQETRQSWESAKDLDSRLIDEDLPAINESPAKHQNDNNLNSKRHRSNSSSFTKLSNLVESSMKRTISVPGSTELNLAANRGLHLSVSAEEWNEVCNGKDPTRDVSGLISPMDDRPIPRERKSRLRRLRNNGRRHTIQEVELPDSLIEENANSLIDNYKQITQNRQTNINQTNIINKYPRDIVEQYELMNHKELLSLVLTQQELLQMQEDKIRDLELYIDNLLVRVMETTPRILQNPYKAPNPAFYRQMKPCFHVRCAFRYEKGNK